MLTTSGQKCLSVERLALQLEESPMPIENEKLHNPALIMNIPTHTYPVIYLPTFRIKNDTICIKICEIVLN